MRADLEKACENFLRSNFCCLTAGCPQGYVLHPPLPPYGAGRVSWCYCWLCFVCARRSKPGPGMLAQGAFLHHSLYEGKRGWRLRLGTVMAAATCSWKPDPVPHSICSRA